MYHLNAFAHSRINILRVSSLFITIKTLRETMFKLECEGSFETHSGIAQW